jgi:hypothetical protein
MSNFDIAWKGARMNRYEKFGLVIYFIMLLVVSSKTGDYTNYFYYGALLLAGMGLGIFLCFGGE